MTNMLCRMLSPHAELLRMDSFLFWPFLIRLTMTQALPLQAKKCIHAIFGAMNLARNGS